MRLNVYVPNSHVIVCCRLHLAHCREQSLKTKQYMSTTKGSLKMCCALLLLISYLNISTFYFRCKLGRCCPLHSDSCGLQHLTRVSLVSLFHKLTYRIRVKLTHSPKRCSLRMDTICSLHTFAAVRMLDVGDLDSCSTYRGRFSFKSRRWWPVV